MSIKCSKEYLSFIEDDMEQSTKDAIKQQNYIFNSTARYHGNYVRTCYMPKIFSEDEYSYFSEIIHTLYGIFDKIINKYFDDSEYRKKFGFDDNIEKLILRCDRKYLTIPIARIDIFYNEETKEFKFCEFNTDGSSAMNEDRELNNSIKDTAAYKKYAGENEIRTCELFYSWIDELAGMYEKKSGGRKLKNVAIADFTSNASMEEFEVFEKCFKNRGFNVEICEIKDMVYDKHSLKTKNGMEVQAVYRRAVTSDILKHYDEVSDFIAAAVDNNVLLFGDFFTQIVHNKILYKILWDADTTEMLSEKQKEFVIKHVPKTFTGDVVSKKQIIENKDKWILKPQDSYGSKGIYPGISFTAEEWKDIIENKVDFDSYIIQEFYTPYACCNYILENNKLRKGMFYNLTGLYVYNGKFTGIYSRISKEPIISTQYNEMALPTIIVK